MSKYSLPSPNKHGVSWMPTQRAPCHDRRLRSKRTLKWLERDRADEFSWEGCPEQIDGNGQKSVAAPTNQWGREWAPNQESGWSASLPSSCQTMHRLEVTVYCVLLVRPKKFTTKWKTNVMPLGPASMHWQAPFHNFEHAASHVPILSKSFFPRTPWICLACFHHRIHTGNHSIILF